MGFQTQPYDVVQRTLDTAAYGSAAGTAVMGITANEIGVIIGAICAVATATASIYYQRKRDRREEEALRIDKYDDASRD